MRTNLLFVILLLVFFLSLPISPSAEMAGSEPVIISFEEKIDYELLEELGAVIHEELTEISTVVATVPERPLVTAAATSADIHIEEDQIVQAAVQTSSWGLQKIGASHAAALGYTGKGVKIAVLDSGINGSHPDLKLAGGASFISGSDYFNDLLGHGTHVAGIIAALNNDIGTVGVVPDSSLYSVKVLSDTGRGSLSTVLSGLDWAIAQQVDLINLSLTTESDSPGLKAALQKAYDAGILVVAASGNSEQLDGTQVDVLYPARYSSVIAVGSIGKDNSRSSFSYYGPSVEFAAPGEAVRSTHTNPDTLTHNDYGSLSGTSVATPFVTGVFAQYIEAYPYLSNKQIREVVKRNALDIGPTGKDIHHGYGLVQSLHTQASLFPDLPLVKWYLPAIESIVSKGIITGYPDGTFQPEHAISREQAVAMIGRAVNLEPDTSINVFSDVRPASFGSGYINSAYKLGYIEGRPDGNFYPADSVTRGDVAVILQRVFNFSKSGESSFRDVRPTIYYADAVQAAYENGIVNGFEDGTFRPGEAITRAQFAAMLHRALLLP
ncbi:S8 family peptidase [Planococcus lenghuensis]|uniref:S8 family peptidase n=1 Tax=Planococcus lenghuensis TaxID=2213202 RepID=UPI0012ECA139|nr:S8 family serine peptidase [Planococcus lenghuensis]